MPFNKKHFRINNINYKTKVQTIGTFLNIVKNTKFVINILQRNNQAVDPTKNIPCFIPGGNFTMAQSVTLTEYFYRWYENKLATGPVWT